MFCAYGIVCLCFFRILQPPRKALFIFQGTRKPTCTFCPPSTSKHLELTTRLHRLPSFPIGVRQYKNPPFLFGAADSHCGEKSVYYFNFSITFLMAFSGRYSVQRARQFLRIARWCSRSPDRYSIASANCSTLPTSTNTPSSFSLIISSL